MDTLDSEQSQSGTPLLLIIGGACLALVLVIMAGVLWIGLQQPRVDNGPRAIGALKAITNAQVLYREGDKDGDGTLQYSPSLKALTKTGPGGQEDLIDEVLASGTKQGYSFAITSADEFSFTVNANPVEPGETGERFFGANSKGELFYSTTGPVRWNPDGSSPDPQLGR